MSERKCVNCGNNIREETASGTICRCAVDGRIIGYIQRFEWWCHRWKRDRKWDKEKEARTRYAD